MADCAESSTYLHATKFRALNPVNHTVLVGRLTRTFRGGNGVLFHPLAITIVLYRAIVHRYQGRTGGKVVKNLSFVGFAQLICCEMASSCAALACSGPSNS